MSNIQLTDLINESTELNEANALSILPSEYIKLARQYSYKMQYNVTSKSEVVALPYSYTDKKKMYDAFKVDGIGGILVRVSNVPYLFIYQYINSDQMRFNIIGPEINDWAKHNSHNAFTGKRTVITTPTNDKQTAGDLGKYSGSDHVIRGQDIVILGEKMTFNDMVALVTSRLKGETNVKLIGIKVDQSADDLRKQRAADKTADPLANKMNPNNRWDGKDPLGEKIKKVVNAKVLPIIKTTFVEKTTQLISRELASRMSPDYNTRYNATAKINTILKDMESISDLAYMTYRDPKLADFKRLKELLKKYGITV